MKKKRQIARRSLVYKGISFFLKIKIYTYEIIQLETTHETSGDRCST